MTWKRIVGAIALMAAVGGVAFSFGVQVQFAFAWGLLAGLIVFSFVLTDLHVDTGDWPPSFGEATPRTSEVARLAWSFRGAPNQATGMAMRRLRAYAARRMARHGLDLDNPAHVVRIDARYGAGTVDLLQRESMLASDFARLLDRLETEQPTTGTELT